MSQIDPRPPWAGNPSDDWRQAVLHELHDHLAPELFAARLDVAEVLADLALPVYTRGNLEHLAGRLDAGMERLRDVSHLIIQQPSGVEQP